MKKLRSKRYCLFCDKIMGYEYDRNVLHSRCRGCGTQSSAGINPSNPILKHFLEREKRISAERGELVLPKKLSKPETYYLELQKKRQEVKKLGKQVYDLQVRLKNQKEQIKILNNKLDVKDG